MYAIRSYYGVGGRVGTGTVAAHMGGSPACYNLQAVGIPGKFGQTLGVIPRLYNGHFVGCEIKIQSRQELTGVLRPGFPGDNSYNFV